MDAGASSASRTISYSIRSLANAPLSVTNLLLTPPAMVAAGVTEDDGGCVAVPSVPAVNQVVRTAQQLCGGLPIEEALRAVEVQSEPARLATQVLLDHGFRRLLDLQMLGGGQEATEIMDELAAAAGPVSIADRAKIRVLVGDREHVNRLLAAQVASPDVDLAELMASGRHTMDRGIRWGARKLQDVAKAESDAAGVSMDTVAIVLSVLVGAAGYVVQAYLAQKADQSAHEQAHEVRELADCCRSMLAATRSYLQPGMQLHIAEMRRQREHEQMVAQINRTERWLE
eukprot:SAG31_NODE_305_length_18002_cov_7.242808_3_plen_286_part_00